ncbi:MAG: BolA family transcriptional regulator [Deltaproteobacteria bacterium]|nr:BolA family transcriptional regulator [Deltaproteobacteria bacterium]
MKSEETIEKMRGLLKESFHPLFIEIQNDTIKHIGHKGAQPGKGHFKLTMVSEKFEGKKLLEQHRMVKELLHPLFGTEMHALQMNLYAPEEWKQKMKTH